MPKIAQLPVVSVAGLALCLAAVAAASAPAQEEPTPNRVEVRVEDAAAPATEVTLKRIPVPSNRIGEDHPYTIEVPVNWGPRRDLPLVGVVIGPPSGDPSSNPEMPLVRESAVDVSDPAAILSNLEANASQGDWTLLEGEVRDFGDVKGLWIVRKLPPSGMHGERVNLAVKVPLGDGSLDLTTTVPEEDYDGVLEQKVKRILFSVRPAAPPVS